MIWIQIRQENEHIHKEDYDMIYSGKWSSKSYERCYSREDPTVPIKRVYYKVAPAMNRGDGDWNIYPNSIELEPQWTTCCKTWSGVWSHFWSGFFLILFKNAFCFIYKNSYYNLLPDEGIIWWIDYIKIYGWSK